MAPLARRIGGLRAAWAAGMTLGLALVACEGRGAAKGAGADSTNVGAPAGATSNAPRASLTAGAEQPSADSILAWGRGLSYDAAHGAEHAFGAGANQVRLVLQSQDSSWTLTAAQLAGGRILGRIINRDSIGFPRYNLAPRDTVYWWADSTASGWRSVLVSSTSGVVPITRGLRVNPHAGKPHTSPAARWTDPAETLAGSTTSVAAGVGPWIACLGEGCCTPP